MRNSFLSSNAAVIQATFKLAYVILRSKVVTLSLLNSSAHRIVSW